MTETALNYTTSKTPDSSSHNSLSPLATDDLERYANDYLLDCDYRMQAPRTIETRRIFLQNLVWSLRHREYTACGTTELRQFFSYLQHGHEEPGGRWGHLHLNRPVRRGSAQFILILRSLLRCSSLSSLPQ